MPDQNQKHVVIIGAGPGGYTAAFYAADLGFKVTLINREPRPGGTCLLRGCIPSKGLLHAAALIQETRHAQEWGLNFGEVSIDLDKLRAFKDGYVEKLSNGIRALAKARKVKMFEAEAVFKSKKTLSLKDPLGNHLEDLTFDYCVIATGSASVIPKVWDMDFGSMMDSTGALMLKDIPSRLLVVGAGYIGLEMATLYAGLGSKVTVVEAQDKLLPTIDKDLLRPLSKVLHQKMDINLGVKVDRIKQVNGKVEVSFDFQTFSDGKVKAASLGKISAAHGIAPLHFDKVLVAMGRKPNSHKMGLAEAGIASDAQGFIEHDSSMLTDNSAVWVIGDAAGGPMLAHKASAEAKIAVDAMVGQSRSLGQIPAVIFTDPELATVGLSEIQAKEQGLAVKVSRFPWAASGKALSQDRSEGLTKLIFDAQSEKLLGAGIVGAHAGDLISEATLAIEQGLDASQLGHVIHPHPTLSETLLESAEAFLGISTHLHRPRR